MKGLDDLYPDPLCSLEFVDALQLLISTQLSAQCTDARVNIVTKELFKKYKTVHDYAGADPDVFEQDIKSTGFYKNKTKNIIACCKTLIKNFNGKVPSTMEEMLTLPGVGRKTANLVLNTVYGIPGLVIDTHAKRLVFRMGLTENTDPVKIEFELMKIIPEKRWGAFSHQLVLHGRAVCNARKPKCGICDVSGYCPKKGL